MDVLALAAGFGTRLKERTRSLPKALVRLSGKPLLGYTLDQFLSRPWVDRVVVVTGFEREQVVDFLKTRRDEKPVVEVFNPRFELGNLYSVAAGAGEVRGEFVLTNVDHIFPGALLSHVFSASVGIGAVCDFDRPLTPDCMKVKLTESRRIAKIHKRLETSDAGYIGMTFVRRDGFARYMETLRELTNRADPSAYAEQVLERLAETPDPPSVLDGSGFGWLEIDTPEDFRVAEETLKRHPAFLETGIR